MLFVLRTDDFAQPAYLATAGRLVGDRGRARKFSTPADAAIERDRQAALDLELAIVRVDPETFAVVGVIEEARS